MNKVKEFWKNHKKTICFIGGAVVLGTVILIIGKAKKDFVNISGKNCITWIPGDQKMDLERVKEFLEANKDDASPFAIFKEGPNPNEYVTILLDKVN